MPMAHSSKCPCPPLFFSFFFFTTTTREFPTTGKYRPLSQCVRNELEKLPAQRYQRGYNLGGPVTISLRSLFLSVSFVYPSTTMGTIPSTNRHWQRMDYEPAWTRTLTVHTRSRQYETAMHNLFKGTMVDTGRIPQYVQVLWPFFTAKLCSHCYIAQPIFDLKSFTKWSTVKERQNIYKELHVAGLKGGGIIVSRLFPVENVTFWAIAHWHENKLERREVWLGKIWKPHDDKHLQ